LCELGQQAEPLVALHDATSDDANELLELAHDHEAEQAVQAAQAIRPQALLYAAEIRGFGGPEHC